MSVPSKRLVRFSEVAAAIALIVGLSIYYIGRPRADREESEEYNVFSDYIAQGLGGYSHDIGSQDGLMVILGHTTVSDMLVRKNPLNEYLMLVSSLGHARRNLHIISQWTVLNLLIANLHSEQLKEHFAIPVPYVLATADELRNSGSDPALKERFAHSYGYLTFTRVGFNRQFDEAVFYTEHICGLCGEGKYVYMRKSGGKWLVQGQSGTWISEDGALGETRTPSLLVRRWERENSVLFLWANSRINAGA